jgi:hypothetical protein
VYIKRINAAFRFTDKIFILTNSTYWIYEDLYGRIRPKHKRSHRRLNNTTTEYIETTLTYLTGKRFETEQICNNKSRLGSFVIACAFYDNGDYIYLITTSHFWRLDIRLKQLAFFDNSNNTNLAALLHINCGVKPERKLKILTLIWLAALLCILILVCVYFESLESQKFTATVEV